MFQLCHFFPSFSSAIKILSLRAKCTVWKHWNVCDIKYNCTTISNHDDHDRTTHTDINVRMWALRAKFFLALASCKAKQKLSGKSSLSPCLTHSHRFTFAAAFLLIILLTYMWRKKTKRRRRQESLSLSFSLGKENDFKDPTNTPSATYICSETAMTFPLSHLVLSRDIFLLFTFLCCWCTLLVLPLAPYVQ